MEIFPQSSSSYNNRFSISARQFFIPNRAQLFMYALVSSLLLVLLNGQTIWSKLKANLQADITFSDVIVGNAPFIQKFIDRLSHSRVPEIIFWLLTGCGVYIIVWFIRNVMSNIRNDVVADSYLHPTNYDRRLFWQSVIARKILLFFCMIVLIAYIAAFLKFIAVLAKFFYSAIDDFRLSPSVVEIILSVAITTLLIYLFILLIHLTVNLWRLVYKNL